MQQKNKEIIKILLSNKTKEWNINQIAKASKTDYKTTYTIIKRLTKNKIIELKPFGKSNKVEIKNFHPIIFEVECERRKELLKNKNLILFLDYFKSFQTRLYILLIFGSYAKGTQNKSSDLDIMFIYPDADDRFENKILNITKTIPLNIHIHLFKESEFIAMKNSNTLTVGQEAISNNIILYGIEPYYELIKW